jgi:hypothetical protein
MSWRVNLMSASVILAVVWQLPQVRMPLTR